MGLSEDCKHVYERVFVLVSYGLLSDDKTKEQIKTRCISIITTIEKIDKPGYLSTYVPIVDKYIDDELISIAKWFDENRSFKMIVPGKKVVEWNEDFDKDKEIFYITKNHLINYVGFL